MLYKPAFSLYYKTRLDQKKKKQVDLAKPPPDAEPHHRKHLRGTVWYRCTYSCKSSQPYGFDYSKIRRRVISPDGMKGKQQVLHVEKEHLEHDHHDGYR